MGYDTTAFASYMERQKCKCKLYLTYLDDGVNIDNWTFDALVEQVQAFRAEQDALITQ